MISVPMHAVGPNRYCPYCKRALLQIKDDGKFTLAGRAEATYGIDLREFVPGEPLEMLAVEAHCLRWPCRLRRWWKEH